MMPRPPRPPLFPYTTLFRSPATTEAFATYGEVDEGAVMQQVKMPPGVFTCCMTAPSSTSRSEEHTSELQSHVNLVCRLLLEKKKQKKKQSYIKQHRERTPQT